MSLTTYRRKRRFGKTPEPKGKVKGGRRRLRFVVQEHAARRLHYDFRLELDGVLKSWAVPKGPSLNPADRRLAVMVEDHPLEYRSFEGVIPPGNYGAGRVIVWDQGTYEAAEVANGDDNVAQLRAGLETGHLKFVLHGQKLQGEFALIRMKRGGENNWLLLKKRDEFAALDQITDNDRSAVSGRRLDEVTETPSRPSSRRRKPRKLSIPGAPRSPMPHDVRPMLATLVDRPFDQPDWLFEIKWDGYRAIAEVEADRVKLYSRSGQSFAARFAPLLESFRELGHDAVVDGEVVVLDSEGRSQFQLLQNFQKTGGGRLAFVAFDLLYLDGRDLRELPLSRRKEALARILNDRSDIRLSEHIETNGIAFYEAAVQRGLEGIIAKDASSPYREGLRSREWLKIKTRRRQEAVIAGFTAPRGSRLKLGALVLGVYDGGVLTYIGHTGGGFNSQSLEMMRARLEPLKQSRCPFRTPPRTNAPVQWVRPELVCEVLFQEWTREGLMRQPVFVGLREDKPARSVQRELPERADVPRGESGPGSLGEPALTNLGKVYWPAEKITKGDLIGYYRDVASVMLPYLRDRPQSLHRHPEGIAGKEFFQKDVGKQPPPEWVRTTLIAGEGGDPTRYVLCQDEPTLLYLANLGCIEINPWNSRMGSLDRPDYLVIDLDPQDLPFERVIETARAVHSLLDKSGAESCCKTSGKRGLHIFVPMGRRYATDQVRQFAELVAHLVHAKLPETTSVVRPPNQRRHRVYLDFLQNRRGQTMAAAYSVRPVPGAVVSTPLRWSEVRKGLDPTRFTLRNLRRRLDQVGDLWQPVLATGVDLQECLKRLSKS